MKKITYFNTVEVIKILFSTNEAKRDEVLIQFSEADEATKYELSKAMWAEFHTLRKILADQKLRELLADIHKKKGNLKPYLMQDAQGAVDEEFRKILTGRKQELDELSSVREKLKNLSGLTAPN